MTDSIPDLAEMLGAAAKGGVVAGVSVIANPGAAPQSSWVPAAHDEPAFLAYSITKTFTAAVVLKLCERGRLRLDDSLSRWFPWIDRAERISLRQLLNHSAGIPDYGGLRAYHGDVRSSPSTPWSFERFAAATYD